MSDTSSQITETTSSMVDTIKSGGSGGWTATKIILMLVALGVVGYIFYTIFGGFMSSMSEIFGDAASFLGSIEKDMEDCLKGSWVCITLLFAIIAWPFAKLASYVYKNPSDVAKDAEIETMETLTDLSKSTYDYLQDNKDAIDEIIEEKGYTPEEADLFRQNIATNKVQNDNIEAINKTDLSPEAKQSLADQAKLNADALNSAKASESDISDSDAGDIADEADDFNPIIDVG